MTPTAEDAMHRVFNQPLEVSERAGDGTLSGAVATLAGAVTRDEVSLHDALTIAFGAGAHFAAKTELRFDGPVTDEMVERAARGAYQKDYPDGIWDQIAPHRRQQWLSRSRAVLDAALDPAAHPPADDGAAGS